MSLRRKHHLSFFVCCLLVLSCLMQAESLPADPEPKVSGAGAIELIEADSWTGWKVPSDHWSIEGGVIVGDTKGRSLNTPQWLYTEQRFADFIYTCEVRMTGERKPNSGLYFRVNPFQFQWRDRPPFEAPSGYEFDVALGKHNGSLGDWYARPKLRIYPDSAVMKHVFKVNDWNRMTIRAIGNRIEYWLNGAKIIDYVDEDPKASREGLIGLQIHDGSVMKVELRAALILPVAGE